MQNSTTTDIQTPASQLIPINDTLGNYISHIIPAVLLVAGLATFLYLLLGGLKWITSQGSKDKIQEAKDQITNAIIGLAIVASAWAIYRLIDYFFGIGIAK